ncbi:MAG: hypothetical protein WCH39_22635 [Schlesneria sp.]
MSNNSIQEDLRSANRVQRDTSVTVSRKAGEAVLADGPITEVKVSKIVGKRVFLKVVAPRTTRISRS